MKPAFRILPFVLAFSAAVPFAGPADGVLWFEALHESGGARGVQGAVDEFFSADNQSDTDRLAACFEENGVWLPPTGEVVTGRRAISAWYRARHVRWVPSLSAAVLDLRVDRTTAVVHGAARGTLVPARGGAGVAVDDRFVMILSRDTRSTWKVTRLLWQRGAPAT
ncbi:MAG: nuclear transport factor 2 family protein [Thermoanaerobaculia bacterium]|nr:nuclear transport factor 2 family protein [Thermoanaerobaculia bacterium]